MYVIQIQMKVRLLSRTKNIITICAEVIMDVYYVVTNPLYHELCIGKLPFGSHNVL